MSKLTDRAKVIAGMIANGERIKWGEDSTIIEDLVEEIERLEGRVANVVNEHAKTLLQIGADKESLAKYMGRMECYRDALEELARLGNGRLYGNSDGNMIARRALESE